MDTIDITCFQVVRNVIKDGETRIVDAGPFCKTMKEAEGVLETAKHIYPEAYIGARRFTFDKGSSESMKAHDALMERLDRNMAALSLGYLPVIGVVDADAQVRAH